MIDINANHIFDLASNINICASLGELELTFGSTSSICSVSVCQREENYSENKQLCQNLRSSQFGSSVLYDCNNK